MKYVVIALAILLAGCESGPTPQKIAFDNYAATNRDLVNEGRMKWSTYYEGLYAHAMAASAPALVLRGYIDLIDAAQALEARRITEPEFQQRRRRFSADLAAHDQASNEARRQRERETLRQIIESNERVAAQNQAIMASTLRPSAYQAPSTHGDFCNGFTEGYKTVRGNFALTPLCPLAPLTPLGSTPYREGLKAGMAAAR